MEYLIEPRRLIPPHIHRNEEECSFVIEGTVGAWIGDELVVGGPGTYIVKPRNMPHTFWNPTDLPARALEVISPGGFENYFRELGQMIASGTFTPERRIKLADRYHLPSAGADWIADLKARFGLKLLGE